MKRYIVGISGASGIPYSARLIQALLADPERVVHLLITPAGRVVIRQEMLPIETAAAAADPVPTHPESATPAATRDVLDLLRVPNAARDRVVLERIGDLMAGPASGTFRAEATVVCPCSMKTVAAIAAGLGDNLLTRAADVALKEGWPLLLVPREAPFSAIHLENLLRLARAGAIVIPASPPFYPHPKTIDDLVDFMVQKILDRLGLEYPDAYRWSE